MTGGGFVRHAQRRDELSGWRRHWFTLLVLAAVAMLVGSVAIAGVSLLRQDTDEVGAPEDHTRSVLDKLAYEAFPAWQASQGDTSCPTIRDLLRYTDLPPTQVRDAWRQPIEIRCGEPLPGSVHGLWLRSAGPDGEFGTDDDVMPN